MSHLQGTTQLNATERYEVLRRPCPPDCAHCATLHAAEVAVLRHLEDCAHCAGTVSEFHHPAELCTIGFELVVRAADAAEVRG